MRLADTQAEQANLFSIQSPSRAISGGDDLLLAYRLLARRCTRNEMAGCRDDEITNMTSKFLRLLSLPDLL